MAKTYRDLVFIIIDELKILSDDSTFEPEHFSFAINKYRALLFSQKYKGKKVDIPTVWYQRLTVPFTTKVTGTSLYKSTKKIPQVLDITDPWKYTFIIEQNKYTETINFVNPHKFKFTGFNKWLATQKYATIGIDGFMYVKRSDSADNQSLYYDTILDNPIDADSFNNTNTPDFLDIEFPCEESMIQPIIDLCLKEFSSVIGISRDITNNASDDSSLPKQQ